MSADGEGRSRLSAADYEPPPISTWRATWLLVRYNPLLFSLDALAFIIVGLFPILLGALMGQAFDTLSGQGRVLFNFQTLVFILGTVGVVGTAVEYGARILDFYFSFSLTVLMRKNMMRRILALPGAAATLTAPGEMVSRFAGDARNVRELAIQALQTVMHLVVVLVGVIIMVRLEPRVTAVVFLPLILSVVLVNLLRRQIARYRAAARGAEGDVTGFVGELFGAVQAVKVNNAEAHVNRRFREINEARRTVALRDSLFTEFLRVVMNNTTNLSIGIILLLVGNAMQQGSFTVGNFALFASLLLPVSQSLSYFGQLLALHKQAAVSLKRMIDVLQGGSPEKLFEPGPVYLRKNSGWPEVPFVRKTAVHRLEQLRVTGLSYRYPSTQRGIDQINVTINRGEFVVITGRIGAGKTTLLRAILGLLPADGEWFWNGDPVTDPASFLVPPRTAYTPQVPRLFSATLRDNILMGMPPEEVNIEAAIYAAVMEEDIKTLENGLDAMVGTRGVKLSGGQVQRSAAARMFAQRPSLYVFDDLSSALDVNTEQKLWERLFAGMKGSGESAPQNEVGRLTTAAQSSDTAGQTPTCLVVSHRRPALRRADRILLLKNGRLHDQGQLGELLARNEEMRRLWQGELGEATEED